MYQQPHSRRMKCKDNDNGKTIQTYEDNSDGEYEEDGMDDEDSHRHRRRR